MRLVPILIPLALVAVALMVAMPAQAQTDVVATQLQVTPEPVLYEGDPSIPPGEETLGAVHVDWCAEFLAYNYDDAAGTDGEVTLTLALDPVPAFLTVTPQPGASHTFTPFVEVNAMQGGMQCEDAGWALFFLYALSEDAPPNETVEVGFTISADGGAGNMMQPEAFTGSRSFTVRAPEASEIPPPQTAGPTQTTRPNTDTTQDSPLTGAVWGTVGVLVVVSVLRRRSR